MEFIIYPKIEYYKQSVTGYASYKVQRLNSFLCLWSKNICNGTKIIIYYSIVQSGDRFKRDRERISGEGVNF